MKARGLTAAVVIVVLCLLGLSTGCRCTEEECHKRFPPPSGPHEPDGPIIIVKPGLANPTHLVVDVGGQAQAVDAGLSVFSTYPNCELRGDFIGVRSKQFQFYTIGSNSPVAAKSVTMTSATHRIDVVKTGFGTFYWRFVELGGLGRSCAAMPVGGWTEGVVPVEFKDLLSSSLHDSVQGNGDKARIQAILP